VNAVGLSENERKAEEAIRKAIKLLDGAKAQQTDSPAFKEILWKAASELEYSALVISIVHGLSDHVPQIPKSNPGKGHAEATPVELVSELNSVLERLGSDPEDSYYDLRRVIHRIREIL